MIVSSRFRKFQHEIGGRWADGVCVVIESALTMHAAVVEWHRFSELNVVALIEPRLNLLALEFLLSRGLLIMGKFL